MLQARWTYATPWRGARKATSAPPWPSTSLCAVCANTWAPTSRTWAARWTQWCSRRVRMGPDISVGCWGVAGGLLHASGRWCSLQVCAHVRVCEPRARVWYLAHHLAFHHSPQVLRKFCPARLPTPQASAGTLLHFCLWLTAFAAPGISQSNSQFLLQASARTRPSCAS